MKEIDELNKILRTHRLQELSITVTLDEFKKFKKQILLKVHPDSNSREEEDKWNEISKTINPLFVEIEKYFNELKNKNYANSNFNPDSKDPAWIKVSVDPRDALRRLSKNVKLPTGTYPISFNINSNKTVLPLRVYLNNKIRTVVDIDYNTLIGIIFSFEGEFIRFNVGRHSDELVTLCNKTIIISKKFYRDMLNSLTSSGYELDIFTPEGLKSVSLNYYNTSFIPNTDLIAIESCGFFYQTVTGVTIRSSLICKYKTL